MQTSSCSLPLASGSAKVGYNLRMHWNRIVLLLVVAGCGAAELEVVPLWAAGAPGSEGRTGQEQWVDRAQSSGAETMLDRAVKNVHSPDLTVYLPEEPSRVGVVIFPGGAYRHLAIDKEGHDVARWLTTIGVSAFVVKYRLPENDGYDRATALADARRAVRLVRAHSEQWHVDPEKIGAMGFSAGGDLAIRAGLESLPGDAGASDPVEHFSSKPSFLAPIYPSTPEDLSLAAESPPAFLVHADDDRLSAENSVRFYLALKGAGVSAELHVYSRGGHGFGLRQRGLPVSAWRNRLQEWLVAEDWLARAAE